MKKNERGEITIEGMIVTFISTMMVFLFMSICMNVYHSINLSVAANEAAADVAMTYAASYKDPFENYMELGYFENRELYRHLLMNQSSHKRAVGDKGKWYACYRLRSGEFVPATSDFDLVNVEFKKNTYGRLQIYVTIERKYQHLAAYPFAIFGLDTEYSVKATGVAECYDMIDYINGITFKREVAAHLEKNTLLGKFIKSGVTVWTKIEKIMGYSKEYSYKKTHPDAGGS